MSGNPRLAMIAKIHIAKKDLGLDDVNYRAIMDRETGKDSSAKCSIAELEKILGAFKGMGWRPKPRVSREMRPLRAKINALWRSLYQLGELGDVSDTALAKFVAKSTQTNRRPEGVKRLAWMVPEDADKVIRALRGWCERVGFDQPKADDLKHYAGWRATAFPEEIGVTAGLVARFMLLDSQWKRLNDLGNFRYGDFAHLGAWLFSEYGVQAAHFLTQDQADAAILRLGVWIRSSVAKKTKTTATKAARK